MRSTFILATIAICLSLYITDVYSKGPLVINTWPFINATQIAYQTLISPSSITPTLDALIAGCSLCETMQCDGSVGYGGSPDENGETTLDAMIMDGMTMNVGSVGGIRNIKNAIGVARAVMDHTTHTLLVGSQATDFAVQNGFQFQSLSTPHSAELWEDWVNENCQPNYRKNVLPLSTKSCGPYKAYSYPSIHSDIFRPLLGSKSSAHIQPLFQPEFSKRGHDTIAMIVIDSLGNIASGTTTNGASHKVPGRVGDSPIAGAGSYALKGVGGCGGTGDGDIHLRFLPCYQVVESMRNGMSPQAASEDAMRRMMTFYPNFQGALVAVNIYGQHGGACTGWTFQYSVMDENSSDVQVFTVPPLTN